MWPCACRGEGVNRALVIGPCGAGKSTASHRIARVSGLPLYHLDKLHWRPGWVEGSTDELNEALLPIIDQERWLIDGNYGSTLKTRLARADTLIYLDFPVRLCLWRALKRVWNFRGRSRPDMAEGCPERFDLDFFLYILKWNRNARPRTERLIQDFDGTLLRFRKPLDLEIWLTKLESPDAKY